MNANDINLKRYDKLKARRRAAAKRKKLKHLGKSRSTDTEDEENEDEPDEGKCFLLRLRSLEILEICAYLSTL